MAYIKNFFAMFVLVVGIILATPFGIISLPLVFTPLKKAALFFMYKVAQTWAKCVMLSTGCSLTVSGRENIIKKDSLCFVSNHSGLFDIVLLLISTGRPFGFIAKKELALVPLVNIWILLLGGFFIDRKNPRKALKTINKGVKNIQNGNAMLIFPEGTRSKGRGLLPFRAGSFKLAIRSNAQIIPVAITGSYDIFEKNYIVNPCAVSISFGPAVDSSKVEKQILADTMHAIIDEMLTKDCQSPALPQEKQD
jgi:1-acyl-sn-glycerol-3-phosphate acyltransferase